MCCAAKDTICETRWSTPVASGLRPILMTSLATVVGLLPMAFKLETGSEAYAPLARVIIGGLLTSIVLTIFVVPAAYLAHVSARANGNRRGDAAGGVMN